MESTAHSEIIDRLGGTSVVASLCEVSTQAVSKWRRDGIPHARMMYLKAVRSEVFSTEPVSPSPSGITAQA